MTLSARTRRFLDVAMNPQDPEELEHVLRTLLRKYVMHPAPRLDPASTYVTVMRVAHEFR